MKDFYKSLMKEMDRMIDDKLNDQKFQAKFKQQSLMVDQKLHSFENDTNEKIDKI